MSVANCILAGLFLALGWANAGMWIRSYAHCDWLAYRHGYGPTSLFPSVYLVLTLESDSGRWLLRHEVNDPDLGPPDLGLEPGSDDECYWRPAAPWSYWEWGGEVDPGRRSRYVEDDYLVRVRSCLGCELARQDGTHTSEDTIQQDYRRTQLAIPQSYTTALWFLLSLLNSRRWLQRRAAIRRCRAGCCVVCGYDLRAHVPGQRCPECGTLIKRDGE